MSNKLRMILKTEDCERFSDKDGVYFLDVHGLKVYEAKQLIRNVGALLRSGDSLIIIHGYNHGTAIKDMLASEEKLFRRAYTVVANAFNKGRTSICFV